MFPHPSGLFFVLHGYNISIIIYFKINYLLVDHVMNGKQCKMARNGLNWNVKELAEWADVMPNTISRFERGGKAQPATVLKLRIALMLTEKVSFHGSNTVCVGEQCYEDYQNMELKPGSFDFLDREFFIMCLFATEIGFSISAACVYAFLSVKEFHGINYAKLLDVDIQTICSHEQYNKERLAIKESWDNVDIEAENKRLAEEHGMTVEEFTKWVEEGISKRL
jgi:DNA-binding XRE family transcriptional regulator